MGCVGFGVELVAEWAAAKFLITADGIPAVEGEKMLQE